MSGNVDINSLFVEMMISPKEKKTLRECRAPLGIVIKSPILLPKNYAKEFAIHTDIICEVHDKAFVGYIDEDRSPLAFQVRNYFPKKHCLGEKHVSSSSSSSPLSNNNTLKFLLDIAQK